MDDKSAAKASAEVVDGSVDPLLAEGPVLAAEVVDLLRASLSDVGDLAVQTIAEEVPAYAGALSGEMGSTIREAVRQALDGFLRLAARDGGSLPVPVSPVREAAYAMGRGEARSGRSMDALLAAYRTGARVAWHQLAATAIRAELGAAPLGRFAELVFAYIDDLSAASVAGHTDELAAAGLLRERRLARLASALLQGEDEAALEEAARAATWDPPTTLTAVLVGSAHVRTAQAALDPRTLRTTERQGEPTPVRQGTTTLLVPDVSDDGGRSALLALLTGTRSTVGPTRPWSRARESVERAWRVRATVPDARGPAQDSEEHLVRLVLAADPGAFGDLRDAVLAPLDGESDGSRERLVETLEAWWAYAGRRADVAEALHVHPQTVRYRMGRIRELFGERWEDPGTVLALGVVLASPEITATSVT